MEPADAARFPDGMPVRVGRPRAERGPARVPRAHSRAGTNQPNNQMSQLTLWNPVREVERMSNRINRVFGSSFFPLSGEGIRSETGWSPDVDVIENDKEFVIKADLPEVDKKDLHVSLEDGSLRITGERKPEKEVKGHRFHRLERAWGKFERSFYLPEAAKGEQPKAEFKNGTLIVHLPKSEEAIVKTREVPVS